MALADTSMSDRLTRTQKFFVALQQGLQYSFVEVVFLATFAWGLFGGGGISPFMLWASFVLAAMWILITNGDDAFEDAKGYVLDRYVFVSDFVVSAVLLSLCAALVWSYSWWFSIMLLLAAAQNLRYTAYSVGWLVEAECEQDEKDKDKDGQVS